VIGIRVGQQRARHEQVARHAPHGRQHPRIAHAARLDLVHHHPLARALQRGVVLDGGLGARQRRGRQHGRRERHAERHAARQ